jgi:RND family efflux transporter MFP subunit
MSAKQGRRAGSWKRVLVTAPIGVAVLVLLILYQSGFFGAEKVAPGTSPLPASVPPHGELFEAQQREVPVVYKSVGTLRSRDEVELSSRILARVTDVTARSGDRVKKGDVLVKLDDADLSAAVAQAARHVEAAQANIGAARERTNAALAARDLAILERDRARSLLADKVISKQRHDEAESAARQAVAAWNRAVQDEQAVTSQAAAAEEALKQAQAALAYATISSPMDGIVCERLAEPGDLASPGRIVIRLFDPTRLRIEVPVRESLVEAIKLGDKVHFDVPALGKAFEGDVREIVPAVDPGSRTFMVMVCMGEQPELMPGMFGTLRLEIGSEKAVLVPSAAISRVGQLEYASALVEGEARRVLVRTVEAQNGMRKVISGISPGMKVFVPE